MDEAHATMSSNVECDLTNNNNDDQPKHTENAAIYLTVTEKGKFTWNGPFEDPENDQLKEQICNYKCIVSDMNSNWVTDVKTFKPKKNTAWHLS